MSASPLSASVTVPESTTVAARTGRGATGIGRGAGGGAVCRNSATVPDGSVCDASPVPPRMQRSAEAGGVDASAQRARGQAVVRSATSADE